MRAPAVSFDHLARLTTADGLYEHAEFTTPRTAHGYCVDDVARGLVVTSRQPSPSEQVAALTRLYLAFTVDAQEIDGTSHNRRQQDGRWTDEATTGDHWGRALWGLGTAASARPDDDVREIALASARVGLQARSDHPRAMAYAAIGAAEVLRAAPGDAAARSMLRSALSVIGCGSPDPDWPWPQPRLGYANALIPEALIVIGEGLNDGAVLREGLDLLSWLVRMETRGGHLSVTPTGGWGPGDPRPGFDQQPIEVAALAEACFRAREISGDSMWTDALDSCAEWFLGKNDTGLLMYDPDSGGGYDGLLRDVVNLNQGAESTLAAIATFQLASLDAFALAR